MQGTGLRLEARRLEAITLRLGAIASRLEDIIQVQVRPASAPRGRGRLALAVGSVQALICPGAQSVCAAVVHVRAKRAVKPVKPDTRKQ